MCTSASLGMLQPHSTPPSPAHTPDILRLGIRAGVAWSISPASVAAGLCPGSRRTSWRRFGHGRQFHLLRPKFPRKLDPLFLEFGCSHFEVFLVFFTSLQWNALQYPAIVPEVCMGKPGLSNVSARILRVPGETKAPHKEKTRGGVGGGRELCKPGGIS